MDRPSKTLPTTMQPDGLRGSVNSAKNTALELQSVIEDIRTNLLATPGAAATAPERTASGVIGEIMDLDVILGECLCTARMIQEYI